MTQTQPTGDYESSWTFAAKAKPTTRDSNLIPSLFASVLKMASFSINLYNNFQSVNSKEHIALDKGAKQDFCPKTHLDIIPGNSDAFSAEIKKIFHSVWIQIFAQCSV
jgi:hypothetical protein